MVTNETTERLMASYRCTQLILYEGTRRLPGWAASVCACMSAKLGRRPLVLGQRTGERRPLNRPPALAPVPAFLAAHPLPHHDEAWFTGIGMALDELPAVRHGVVQDLHQVVASRPVQAVAVAHRRSRAGRSGRSQPSKAALSSSSIGTHMRANCARS